ncbi:hypothetical protein ACT89R_29820 (plasmid) [Rhodococcus qingshengii]
MPAAWRGGEEGLAVGVDVVVAKQQGGAGNCERCVSEQFGDRVGVALIGVLCG